MSEGGGAAEEGQKRANSRGVQEILANLSPALEILEPGHSHDRQPDHRYFRPSHFDNLLPAEPRQVG